MKKEGKGKMLLRNSETRQKKNREKYTCTATILRNIVN